MSVYIDITLFLIYNKLQWDELDCKTIENLPTTKSAPDRKFTGSAASVSETVNTQIARHPQLDSMNVREQLL